MSREEGEALVSAPQRGSHYSFPDQSLGDGMCDPRTLVGRCTATKLVYENERAIGRNAYRSARRGAFHLPMIIADVAISEANVDNDFSIESISQHTVSSRMTRTIVGQARQKCVVQPEKCRLGRDTVVDFSSSAPSKDTSRGYSQATQCRLNGEKTYLAKVGTLARHARAHQVNPVHRMRLQNAYLGP
jgi:hypothetical protein